VKREVKEATEEVMHEAGTMITDMLFKDLFIMFDKDNSGYIDFDEFCELSKYMGLHLNQEEMLSMFSQANTNSNNYIDYWEFQNAILLIKLKIVQDTLANIGVTSEELIWIGIKIFIYLILVITFIFLGIFAFSKAEGFNAVINSILPFMAGVAAGTQNIDIKEKLESAKAYVKELIMDFQRKIDGI
jgi:thioredoxin-related protein